MNTKSRIRIVSLALFITVFVVWIVFYIIISDYIGKTTQKQMTLAAGQIIERLGGEFTQVERLSYSLKQNADVTALMRETDPVKFFSLAGKIDGLAELKAYNLDFIDSIVIYGADRNYYRLTGRLGNNACMRLAGTVFKLDMPKHLSVVLENKRYIGYTDEIELGYEGQTGAVVILIEEEKVLEIIRAYAH